MEYTNIYVLEDPNTEQIRYVGKSNDPEKRLDNHLNPAKKHTTHKWNWLKKLKKNGQKPNLKIIDKVPIKEWQFWERYWIEQFRQWGFHLTNYMGGGQGTTFANQTSFKKGHVPWNKGKNHSENVKKKISTSLEGNSCKPKKKVVQLDKQENVIEIYDSMTKAAKDTNSLISKICLCCKRKRKTHNNYKWKYEKDL